MAGNAKEIQRRIKSIKNTKKITRAMEMVAAAKMKREVDKVLSIRAYAHSAWGILANLSKAFSKNEHALLEIRPVKRILVIVITSNRGLCGVYNSQILKKVMEQVRNPKLLKVNRHGNQRIESPVADKDLEFDFVSVGRKGFEYLNRRNYKVIAEFGDLNESPSLDDTRVLSRMAMDEYRKGSYDKVVIAYTDFVNTLTQAPKLRQILPVSKIDLEKQIEDMAMNCEDNLEEKEQIIDYKIEPEPEEVLEELLPRLVEMQVYHSILESNASRQAARMMAMKNATEAAGDMVSQLQYSYNQIRQMGITQEIAEITSGRVALE